MIDNHLPAAEVDALVAGNQVIFETYRSSLSSSTEVFAAKVAKTTPKQIVVHYPGHHGTIEVRFRREDGGRIGEHRGQLLDPAHPKTLELLARKRQERRRQTIDALAARWTRERDNLDVLRQLNVAISGYLDAEADQ